MPSAWMRLAVPPRIAPRLLVIAALSILGVGCQNYAETVSCSSGTVFDENDECVRPAVPDGAVPVETCSDLCDAVGDWSAEQVSCLQGLLTRLGSTPAACMEDLTVASTCNECVTAAGIADELCQAGADSCR